MNLTHCSKLVVGLLVVALAVGAIGTAGAVSFTGDVDQSVEVDSQERIEVTLTDPFEGQEDEWTVRAESDLDDATVTLSADPVDGDIEASGTGEAELDIARGDGVTAVEIEVNGAVGPIFQYSYENRSRENVTGLAVFDGPVELQSWELHRYTEDSHEARQVLDSVSETVDDSGSDDARDRLDEAIAFYDSGEFERAIEAANDARDIAESEGDTRRMLILVGGVVALLAAVGGLAYLLQTRQKPANKLR